MNKQNFLGFLLVTLSAFSFNGRAHAEVKKVKDGDKVSIVISDKWPTKIEFENSRITDIYYGSGSSGSLKFEPSEETGHVKVTPQDEPKKPVEFSLTDAEGNSYEIVASFKKMSPKTVTLRSDSVEEKTAVQAAPPESNKAAISEVIKSLFNRTKNAGQWKNHKDSPVLRIANCKLKLVRSLSKGSYVGELYRIKNTSGEKVKLDEVQFSILGSAIEGISLRKMALANGEETELYIIRSRKVRSK